MMLTYEEWYELNESELHCRFAETGADREMDFNIEDEICKLYEQYVRTFGMEGSDVYCLGNGYIVHPPK